MKWILLLASLFSIGCASVVHLPASTGQAPVVGGRFLGGQAGLDLTNSVPVTTINDTTTNPPTRDRIMVGAGDVGGVFTETLGGSGSAFNFGLGLMERVDVYFTRNIGVRVTPGFRKVDQ